MTIHWHGFPAILLDVLMTAARHSPIDVDALPESPAMTQHHTHKCKLEKTCIGIVVKLPAGRHYGRFKI